MTTKQYASIGKLLFAEFPDLAVTLRQKVELSSPKLTDFTLLPCILERFCELKNIEKDGICGIESTRAKTYNKQVFIATVVKLYSPASLGPSETILVKNLRKELSELLQTKGERISFTLTSVRVFLTVYKDFALEVEEFYNNIIQSLKKIK